MASKTTKRLHLQTRKIDNNEINRTFEVYTGPSFPTTTSGNNNNNNNNSSSSSSANTTQSYLSFSYDELLEQYLILQKENQFLKDHYMPK